MVGFGSSDDAAVYQMNKDQALIQTIDFFPPPVDDPYLFGQIAAANALSDVYAMGGRPVLALNLLAFPSCLDPKCIQEILRGGYEKVAESGAVVAGGHTIEDNEPKYGLSVSGVVHPAKIWRNDTAQEDDVLILTKPIGTGIYALASRGDLLNEAEESEMLKWMTLLNRQACEVFSQFTVHACTDITGFGLLGHCVEMASASEVTFEINVRDIEYFADAIDYAKMGLVPAGAYKNRGYSIDQVEVGHVEDFYLDLLYDPQTSGGLLMSVAPENLQEMLADFRAAHMDTKVSSIGKVAEKSDKLIRLY